VRDYFQCIVACQDSHGRAMPSLGVTGMGCYTLSFRGATQLRRGNLFCGRHARIVILSVSEESGWGRQAHYVILNAREESVRDYFQCIVACRDSHGRAMPSLGVTDKRSKRDIRDAR